MKHCTWRKHGSATRAWWKHAFLSSKHCKIQSREIHVWKSETVAANRVAAINPPNDDTDPMRNFSIDPGIHTNVQNSAEFSQKGKPIRTFSIDPISSIRTRLRTPILPTPFPRLLLRKLAGPMPVRLPAAALVNHSPCFRVRWVSATVAARTCDIVWLRVMVIQLSVLLSLFPYQASRVG